MFGYACRETDRLMPAPIDFAHRIMRRAAEVRKAGQLAFLRPDGKCQVSVRYRDGIPVAIPTVVLSHQHDPDVDHDTLREALIEQVIGKALPGELLNGTVRYLINPTGRFVVGGPHGDTGLTGRKIIVDTYGGTARHGGGAFSGKDPSKVDRSAAYMARYVAKNVVAAGLCSRCEVQLAYAIGVAEPVSLLVQGFRHGQGAGTAHRVGDPRHLRPHACRHHSLPRSPPPDLPADRRVRPLRPGRLLVGTDRRRGPAGRLRRLNAPPAAVRVGR